MECRAFNIQLCSANDIKSINLFAKTRLYAIVSISSTNTLSLQKSPVAKKLGTRFAWDLSMRFYVEDLLLQQNQLKLTIKIWCNQLIGGDKKVGEISIPLKKLFDDHTNHDYEPKDVIYDVIRPSGRQKGVLYFAYSFVPYMKMASSTVSSMLPSAPNLPLEDWID